MRKGLAILVGVTVAVVGIVWATQSLWSDDDGIKEDQLYALALTERCIGVKKLGDKDAPKINGRCFILADLNLPKHVIFVPERPMVGGNLLFESVSNLPVSTVRKTRIYVLEQRLDGESYPAYSYLVWQYHMGTTEPQTFVPTVVIRP